MEKRERIKRIIGIILVALSLGAISFWELGGRESITYDSVAVLRNSVSKDEVITESMIKERKVEKANEGSILFSEKDKIVGLVSSQFIPKGAELYMEYFSESKFKVGEGTGNYILSVPESWVVSYPQTISRGDTALIYAGSELITEVIVAHVRDGSNQEVIYDEERKQSTGTVSLIEVIVDFEKAKAILDYVSQNEDNRLVIAYE